MDIQIKVEEGLKLRELLAALEALKTMASFPDMTVSVLEDDDNSSLVVKCPDNAIGSRLKEIVASPRLWTANSSKAIT